MIETEMERRHVAVRHHRHPVPIDDGVQTVAERGAARGRGGDGGAVRDGFERRDASRGDDRAGAERPAMRDTVVAVALRVRRVRELIHDVGAPGDGARGEAAGYDLAEHRHLRRDAVVLLRTADRVPEARYDFVEDQDGTAFGREPTRGPDELRPDRERAE